MRISHVLPVEEMIWDKLYVMQRDRCDWPDTLNLLYAAGPTLDWQYLFGRLASDAPLGLPPPQAGPDTDRARADLLDRRAWFAAAGEPALC